MKLTEFKSLMAVVEQHKALKAVLVSPTLTITVNGSPISLSGAAALLKQQLTALETQLTAAGVDVNG